MQNDFQKSYNEFKIKISFRAFSAYFQDKEDFGGFFTALSKEKQEKFFKLSKFYNDFVLNSLIEDENTRNYFSLIMIFSLIEATIKEEKHLRFEEYLSKNSILIPDRNALETAKDNYYNQFGVYRKVKKFFDDYVDEECKKIFIYAICVDSGAEQKILPADKKIEQNIKLFYDWRSQFVHNAIMPIAFQKSGFNINKNTIFTTGYSLKDFEQLFEHGFLRYFGYKKNFKHDNLEHKIEQYKNHTISIASEEISKAIKNILTKINQSNL